MRTSWRMLLLAGCFAACSAAGLAQGQPVEVQVPSLDAPGGRVLVLRGFWFAAPASVSGPSPTPAMLLLHGCGGMFDRQGRPALRYTELAQRLGALGVHALALDSLGARGERELCTQPIGQRAITQQQRRRDVLGALQWLAVQAGVDAQRLGVLGWSHGGSAVLAALNKRHPEVAAAGVQPSLAVAFYPGCSTELQRGFTAQAPLLMLLGEADDWTPAAPCKRLAESAAQAQDGPVPQWGSYAGAYHGFDGTEAVRLRKDVPNGVRRGQGVHVGADPAARAAAALRLDAFLRMHWALKP